MTVMLRRALSSDVTSIRNLIRQRWLETYAPHVNEGTCRYALTGGIDAHIDLTFDGMIVAEGGGQILGVVSSNYGWVSGLFVNRDVIRNGIGTALLQAAVGWGGCDMEVHHFNLPARRVALKFGCSVRATYVDNLWGSMLVAHHVVLPQVD